MEGPTKVKTTSVISSNHYEISAPPAVIEENLKLQEGNKLQLERAEKLK